MKAKKLSHVRRTNRAIAGPHIVRYGISADQKFLLNDFLITYDQLIFNANIVSHIPGALATFLSEKARSKPYFIDPQTHAFQHDLSYLESSSEKKAGELKKSITKLLDAYGAPIKDAILGEDRPVRPGDFQNDKQRKDFCRRVLTFQLQAISKEAKESTSAKYYKYLQKKGRFTLANFSPTMVIAPYFYLTSNTMSKWLPINISCARDSQIIASSLNIPIGVQIVISRDLLMNENMLKELKEQYLNKAKPDVFLVWIDQFSESESSRDELIAFVNFFRDLGTVAKVINLYGGFFSVALRGCQIAPNLIGVAHGLEYGEDRGVVPVGGGVPVAKFYFPSLHTRLPFRDALRAMRAFEIEKSVEGFYKKVCDCKGCKKVIVRDPSKDFLEYGKGRVVSFVRNGFPVAMEFPLPETKDKCVTHYMWCKQKEYRRTFDIKEISKELTQTENTLQRFLGEDGVMHCNAWKNVLLHFQES